MTPACSSDRLSQKPKLSPCESVCKVPAMEGFFIVSSKCCSKVTSITPTVHLVWDPITSPMFVFLCVWFFFFSCFAALPRISSAMLNRSGERGHLFCYPKIGKEEFGFSLLRMFSALVFFHRNSYWVQEAPFSTWLLKLFIMNGCSTLLSVFFRLYWYDVVFLL